MSELKPLSSAKSWRIPSLVCYLCVNGNYAFVKMCKRLSQSKRYKIDYLTQVPWRGLVIEKESGLHFFIENDQREWSQLRPGCLTVATGAATHHSTEEASQQWQTIQLSKASQPLVFGKWQNLVLILGSLLPQHNILDGESDLAKRAFLISSGMCWSIQRDSGRILVFTRWTQVGLQH